MPNVETFPLQSIAGIIFNNQILIERWIFQNGVWVSSFPFLGYPITGSAIVKAPFPNNNLKSLLSIGGEDADGKTSNQWLVLTTSGWEYVVQPTLPRGFMHHCAVLFNSTTVLVIGGQNSDYVLVADVFIFNSVTMAWSKAANLNVVRQNHLCAMISSSDGSQTMAPMVVSGDSGTTSLTSSEYSLDLKSWTPGPALPYAITYTAIVNDRNGGIVLVGGLKDNVLLDTLMYLRHAQGQWEILSIKLKLPRSNGIALALPDGAINCG